MIDILALAARSDVLLFFPSLLGFILFPRSLGTKAWLALAWFVGVSLLVLAELWKPGIWMNMGLFMVAAQAPWVIGLIALVSHRGDARELEPLYLRAFLLWNSWRIMGLHFLPAALLGIAPLEYGIELGISELLVGLGAFLLFVFFKPHSRGFQVGVAFWNAFGLISMVLGLSKVILSHPASSIRLYSSDIFHYMVSYPQAWMTFFWFPLALLAHCLYFARFGYLPRATLKA